MAGKDKGQLKLLLKQDPEIESRIEKVCAIQDELDNMEQEITAQKESLKALKAMRAEKEVERRTAIKRIREPEFEPEENND